MTAQPQRKTQQRGGHWLGDTANATARAQVTAVIHTLSRARWQQIFVDCASTAVFWAVLASIVAVAAIRIGWLSLPPWVTVLGLLVLALAGASVIAFFRRPNDLDVAIDADLKLNLKQRLSTAWEFMSLDDHNRSASPNDVDRAADDTASQLATQAVKARLPARARARQVFASRANAFAMMTPVAVIALILVSIVDLGFTSGPRTAEIDEMVISEGVRLRDYGRRMQARARQLELAHSARQSLHVQKLGNRMQSGGLSREAALSRLRDLDDELNQERREALNSGDQTNVGPLSAQTVDSSAQSRGPSPRELLQQMLDGRIRPADAASQMLNVDPSALSRHGISSAQMRDALERFEAGDRKTLEDMLDKMSRTVQATRDAKELSNAREQVARARESLGDRNARPSDDPANSEGLARKGQDGTPSDAGRGAQAALDDDGGEDGSGASGGRGTNSQRKREPRTSNKENADRSGPLLKAQGQIRDGGVFVSEARVLPRAGKVTTDNTRIDAQYTQQLEQVLSNEQYPLHHKEFIRRYFLNLSEGTQPAPATQDSEPAKQ